MEAVSREMTLVILKPEALRRKLCGSIIARFEQTGLSIVGLSLARLPVRTVEELYREHRGKEFFPRLVSTMSSSPVILLALAGEGETVDKVRKMIGSTDPAAASPGTIRGDLAYMIARSDNLIHASDSRESAARELKLLFPGQELDDHIFP